MSRTVEYSARARQDLRFFPANRCLMFYLTNEAERTVTVIRITYGGRDIREQLGGTME